MSTPTSTEQRLRDSLDRAATAVDVDAAALYAATRARLDEAPPAARRRAWLPVVVAAAAVVLVVGAGVVLLDRVTEGARDLSVSGEVADDFTCPVQRTTTFGPGNDDDSFLPELSGDLQPRGEADVTRNWEADPTDNGAVLRLGNADGSLASVTTFAKRGGSYEAVEVTKCTNDVPVGPQAPPLITPDLPAERDEARPPLHEGAVKVVDRLTYDTAGLETRQTIWADRCGSAVCLVAGSRSGYTRASLGGDAAVPSDRSDQLADPDDVVGQDLGLTLVALYDRTSDVGLVGSSPDGVSTPAEVVRSEAWPGRLFLLLAPTHDLWSVSVLPTGGGREREYTLDRLAD
jgi:hypothetical protein